MAIERVETPFKSATDFFLNIPELSDSSKKVLAVFREEMPKSFDATATIPHAVRALPHTIAELQEAKDLNAYNCLKTAAAFALLVIGMLSPVAVLLVPINLAKQREQLANCLAAKEELQRVLNHFYAVGEITKTGS